MEKYISELTVVLKEYQDKELLPDIKMIIFLNEIVAMKL